MQNILYQIQQKYSNLTKTQKKIADVIIKNPKNVIYFTTEQLVSDCDVSHAAISRFCHFFNFSGLKELQVCLARELSDDENYHFVSPESEEFTSNLCENILNQNILALKDTFKMCDKTNIEKVSKMILKANKIMISGIGASNVVAVDFMQKLLRIQKNAAIFSDRDLEKIALLQYNETDFFIGISYSGEKEEILTLARQAKKQNVPIIAITRIGETTLSKIANYTFEVAALEDDFRSSALSSRIAQLYIVDILFHTCCLYLGDKKINSLQNTFNVIRKR